MYFSADFGATSQHILNKVGQEVAEKYTKSEVL
jgi:hypothetical protein